jgi:hypothetical protein
MHGARYEIHGVAFDEGLEANVTVCQLAIWMPFGLNRGAAAWVRPLLEMAQRAQRRDMRAGTL